MENERVKAFAEKVFGDMAGAMTSGLGFVGVKTGLFRAIAGRGSLTLEGRRNDQAAITLRRGVAEEKVCAGHSNMSQAPTHTACPTNMPSC
jgi:hypothetical protein